MAHPQGLRALDEAGKVALEKDLLELINQFRRKDSVALVVPGHLSRNGHHEVRG